MLSNLDARRCGTLCFCVIFRGGNSAAADDEDDVINRFVHCDENNEELAANRLFTLGRFLANRLASIVTTLMGFSSQERELLVGSFAKL